MPRKTTVLPTLGGRRQADRPPLTAAKLADAERALPGAMSVPIEQIVPDPDQPRKDTDPARVKELAASLMEHGILQPLLVREHGYLDDGRTRYMIVAGGRRYAAAQQAGLARVPVVVRDTAGAALRIAQLVENLQRQNLAPLEEARAFQELIDAEGLSAEELGKRLSISGQQIRDRLLLLSDQAIADAVQREQVPATVASEMLRLPQEGQRLLRSRLEAGERLARSSIRETRARLKEAGVTNPRAKGGGRAAHREIETPRGVPKDQSGFDPVAPIAVPSPERDQSRFDPAVDMKVEHSGNLPSQKPSGTLLEALAGLDRASVINVLSYGIERRWTCQELLQAILGDSP